MSLVRDKNIDNSALLLSNRYSTVVNTLQRMNVAKDGPRVGSRGTTHPFFLMAAGMIQCEEEKEITVPDYFYK